jgi:NADPH:quinone reductase-like Zn-dependent oxidoreductase
MRAVRFDEYGGVDVLNVVEVESPAAGPGRVVVRVKAAGINPGEAGIREGRFHDRWPAHFPEGEGSDLAGVVEEVGEGVAAFAPGDEVLGFTHERASHAELVAVDADNLTPKPGNVSWEAAGALFIVGTTAYAAVRAVGLEQGDTVVISAAAGGVGTLAVQLAHNAGAQVIGLASSSHHGWLADHGVVPVVYRDGVAERIKAASGGKVDAFIDTFGGGYVGMAIKDLGVEPERIDTIADFQAAMVYGVKSEGTAAAASAEVLAELVAMISEGCLEVPIEAVYPLEEVRDAYRQVEKRHTLGKIVLRP